MPLTTAGIRPSSAPCHVVAARASASLRHAKRQGGITRPLNHSGDARRSPRGPAVVCAAVPRLMPGLVIKAMQRVLNRALSKILPAALMVRLVQKSVIGLASRAALGFLLVYSLALTVYTASQRQQQQRQQQQQQQQEAAAQEEETPPKVLAAQGLAAAPPSPSPTLPKNAVQQQGVAAEKGEAARAPAALASLKPGQSPCPICKGAGQVRWEAKWAHDIPCPKCLGKGHVKKGSTKPSKP
ncbi:hypothetical protein ACKKBG_A31310 [Auxenochlorella protothecoides x Auxenochlorella symbiontica]